MFYMVLLPSFFTRASVVLNFVVLPVVLLERSVSDGNIVVSIPVGPDPVQGRAWHGQVTVKSGKK